MVGKAKVGDLAEEIREELLRRLKKEITVVVKEIVERMRYLVRLQDGLEKEMSLNQLTIVAIRSELEEDIEVREVEIITEVREELGCYH